MIKLPRICQHTTKQLSLSFTHYFFPSRHIYTFFPTTQQSNYPLWYSWCYTIIYTFIYRSPVILQRRNQSAPGYGSRVTKKGDGPVLYKVYITTADKKGAGTDAKVGSTGWRKEKLNVLS